MRSWVVCLIAMTLAVTNGLDRAEVVYQWKSMDFVFPNQTFKDNLTNSGAYVSGLAVPIDVDKAADGRVFVSLPKVYAAGSATLCTLSNETQDDGSPLLAPYPDWGWHRDGDCDGIVSVFRIQIDECNRLWVIDSGMVNYSNRTQLCPPQLLVFDLATNTLITRHRFPSNILVNNHMVCTVVVETSTNSCQNAYAYIADVYGFGLYVFSLQLNRSWRINHNYFYPFPRNGRFLVSGVEFYVMNGVLGLALSPPQRDGQRRLYFQSTASDSLSWVQTSVLRNESNFPNGSNLVPGQFHIYSGTRASQATSIAVDSRGVMFFSYLSYNTINCWNTRSAEYGRGTIAQLDRDDEALSFVSGLKVLQAENGSAEEVWMLSCRFQSLGNLNMSDYNFRIVKANIQQVVRGSICAR